MPLRIVDGLFLKEKKNKNKKCGPLHMLAQVSLHAVLWITILLLSSLLVMDRSICVGVVPRTCLAICVLSVASEPVLIKWYYSMTPNNREKENNSMMSVNAANETPTQKQRKEKKRKNRKLRRVRHDELST